MPFFWLDGWLLRLGTHLPTAARTGSCHRVPPFCHSGRRTGCGRILRPMLVSAQPFCRSFPFTHYCVLNIPYRFIFASTVVRGTLSTFTYLVTRLPYPFFCLTSPVNSTPTLPRTLPAPFTTPAHRLLVPVWLVKLQPRLGLVRYTRASTARTAASGPIYITRPPSTTPCLPPPHRPPCPARHHLLTPQLHHTLQPATIPYHCTLVARCPGLPLRYAFLIHAPRTCPIPPTITLHTWATPTWLWPRKPQVTGWVGGDGMTVFLRVCTFVWILPVPIPIHVLSRLPSILPFMSLQGSSCQPFPAHSQPSPPQYLTWWWFEPQLNLCEQWHSHWRTFEQNTVQEGRTAPQPWWDYHMAWDGLMRMPLFNSVTFGSPT